MTGGDRPGRQASPPGGAGGGDDREWLDRLDALCAAAREQFSFPRDRTLMRTHATALPGRDGCFVYPMGADGRIVAEALAAQADRRLLGCIDRSSAGSPAPGGGVIGAPETLVGHPEPVLVCHIDPRIEEELMAYLRSLGIGGERLVSAYRDAGFLDSVRRARIAPAVDALAPMVGSLEHLVLRGRDEPPIADAELAAVYPPDATVVLAFDGAGCLPGAARRFMTIGLEGDPGRLDLLLPLCRPRTLHIQGPSDRAFLGYLARRLLPDATLVWEPSDAAEIPDGTGGGALDALNRSSCDFLLRRADVILAMDDAPAMDRDVSPERRAAIVSLHPLHDVASLHGSAELPPGFAYRTPLPPPETGLAVACLGPLPDGWGGGRANQIRVDVFLPPPTPGAGASRPGPLSPPWAGGPVRCFQGMHRQRLLGILPAYDYGLVTAGNGAGGAFAAFVSAGLPVIVAAGSPQAGRVREFGAGIVLDDGAVDPLDAILRSAEPARHHDGARRLLEAMAGENARALDRLRVLIASRSGNPPVSD